MELPCAARADLDQFLTSNAVMLKCFRGQGHDVVSETGTPEWIPPPDFHEAVRQPRACRYYFRYNPGYPPKQHLELLRDAEYRAFLVKVSLLSATMGASVGALLTLVLS